MKKRLSILLLIAIFIQAAPAQNLVIRIDDIGSFHSANKASIESYRNGIAQSVEFMPVAPWAPEAVKMLRENPGLDVGVHLVLNSEWENMKWRPLTSCPSVCDANGYFLPMMGKNEAYRGLSLSERTPDVQEIEQEFRAQIEMAKKLVPRVSHLTGHMYCTLLNDEVYQMVLRLSKEYGLPLIDGQKSFEEFGYSSLSYDGPTASGQDKISSFLRSLEKMEKGKTYLFLDHPAYNDSEMESVFHIGYENVGSDRQGVTELLTSEQVRNYIREHGIRLMSIKRLVTTPRRGSQVEKVKIRVRVGDVCQMVEEIEMTVRDETVLMGLKAKDFDLVNNVPDGYTAKDGGALKEHEKDGISIKVSGNKLTLRFTPFNINGRMEGFSKRHPWALKCTNPDLAISAEDVDEKCIDIIDDCIHGSFTYAGITREYMLHLPKDKNGKTISNAPLLVWQIGGGEYNQSMMTAALANRCLVSLPTEGIPAATLVFAIANPNYSYSASLDPEKIKLIDRNNALQMAFIDRLISEGKVDKDRLFCAGASSGGGCTMRFMMQFPGRFKAAIPCCAMDPIIPIHKVEEKYDGQFVEDLVKAFQGDVYRWNGQEMAPDKMDTEAFVRLPMFFVHAEKDNTCKVISSKVYLEARKRLGARNDRIQIFDEAYMQSYGVGGIISHFSWVPLLDDFSKGTAMDWLVGKMR